MTYLAVPIAAEDFDQSCSQIKTAAAAGAQILELRTDYLKPLDTALVEKLIAEVRAAKRTLRIIVTCRSKSQGGWAAHPDKLRVEVLAVAIKQGVEFIDFEYESFLNLENQEKLRLAMSTGTKTRLILSAHNFKGKFDNIASLYRHIVTTYSAAIPKLVYTAKHINDSFEALDLLCRTSDQRIVFAMGQAGLITRIIAPKLGSYLTYASVDEQAATAPGQLTAEALKNIYRFDDIDAKTELYGIIGAPVAHSLSPAVHNACFADININKLYLPILVQGGWPQFEQFMRNIMNRRWLDFRGFSVTIPHKQNALQFVLNNSGRVEPLTEIIGAANTIIISPQGRLFAYNTDYKGALDALAAAGLKKLNGLKVAVVGAGGAARAIVAGLTSEGAKLTIYNRTVKKAQKLAEQFNCSYAPLSDIKNLDAELLINCTSLGMHPDIDATAIPPEVIKKGMTVFDTVYNPPQTLLLKNAKKAKAKTISGLDMFISQAAEQFKLFTEKKPNINLLRQVVTERLASS